MNAGQPGTLLEHGTSVSGGVRYRTWKQGPIKGREEYSVGPRGELRHTHPQFKGSKKNRLRWRAKFAAAMDQTPPLGYTELGPKEKVVPLDVVMDVEVGRWCRTAYVGFTVGQMRQNFPRWPRAARVTPHDKVDCKIENCPLHPPLAPQCCERDHNHDGNCDRHLAKVPHTSFAKWPDGFDSGSIRSDNVTTDNHDSKEAADVVCRMLEREGFGGDGQTFPVRTWSEPVE